jgi:hypothetical protein
MLTEPGTKGECGYAIFQLQHDVRQARKRLHGNLDLSSSINSFGRKIGLMDETLLENSPMEAETIPTFVQGIITNLFNEPTIYGVTRSLEIKYDLAGVCAQDSSEDCATMRGLIEDQAEVDLEQLKVERVKTRNVLGFLKDTLTWFATRRTPAIARKMGMFGPEEGSPFLPELFSSMAALAASALPELRNALAGAPAVHDPNEVFAYTAPLEGQVIDVLMSYAGLVSQNTTNMTTDPFSLANRQHETGEQTPDHEMEMRAAFVECVKCVECVTKSELTSSSSDSDEEY